jgi:hypothetical protein
MPWAEKKTGENEMRTINSSNGNNRTSNRPRASSDVRGRLSAGALAKLRGELRRLARSNRPRTIEFALATMTKYPELGA